MKYLLCLLPLLLSHSAKAWWDPGHMLVAMIAYAQLDEASRERADELSMVLERDYPYVNHFVVTATWPDDLKTEGVRSFDSWHYTNIPYNPDGLPLPPRPEVDVVWAIGQALAVLRDRRARMIDKARHLGFLTHFVGDLHQPMHTTTRYTQAMPGGNRGGNGFELEGPWRNLHALWDDGCGALSDYNDIRPYGEPQEPLSEAELGRIRRLAEEVMAMHPPESFPAMDQLDPEFWALEGHRLAVRYGYQGPQHPDHRGNARYLQPGDRPSEAYLKQAQEVVWRQLALAGYRLGRLLNEVL